METEPTTDRLTLHESASTHQADPDTPPSEAVIDAIAADSSFDALELADEFGPLYDVIDPSALDSLFQSTVGADRCVGSVTFEYAGYRVGVDQTGRVELAALE
ncbi:hypothetical protein NP511_01565 [Natrinema thermotolerans]|uniref:Halobacterial output domain-containing protein n=1 Tax=Natrinema thermotolerans TaxID=121872 RepID=A0AAF0PDX4_9EURY|nr:HalOD1 output domain-containing protein [Natrinema thermotolerans]QCC60662.1 hypothetical protein DVR14_19275 [Natrinema thermotolerans]QCC61548.1 hypothetical protein DVR14_23405 [Natrinema thermotolerans]WMT07704.1 hypothetical protein NP511_20280 [Natrinema thermotolerans]WMT08336.1 hypothetical protein NP511_01565 [Natrinema thermotolerans]